MCGFIIIREGVNKKTYNFYIFFIKNNKNQNVLKFKNMYLVRISLYLDYFSSKSYVLDQSESIDMHIKKK